MASEHDVIVVGAGISGMACALRLEEQGLNVLVLEAKDRVGGRLLSGKAPKLGCQVDLGGAYISPKQRRISRLAKEVGVETYDVYDKGAAVVEIKGKAHKNTLGTVFESLDALQAAVQMDNLTNKVDVENPYAFKDYEKYDKMSTGEWAANHSFTEAGRDMLLSAFEGGACRSAQDCSMLFLLVAAKRGGSITFAGAVSGGAQECKFIGGSAQIPQLISEKLQNVKLEHVVSKIDQTGDKVVVSCENGQEFACKQLVLALAPSILQNVTMVPELPADKRIYVDSMKHGKVVKIITYYEKPFWREKGYSGTVAFTDLKAPLLSSIDDCSPDGKRAALVGFMHTSAKYWMEQSVEDRKKAVTEQYRLAFNNDAALEPIDYVEYDWRTEDYLPGCYAASLPPGVMTEADIDTFKKPFDRIHFAGTETAKHFPGYMDGGVESGERAAQAIFDILDIKYTIPPVPKDTFPSLGVMAQCVASIFRTYVHCRKLLFG